MITVTHDFNPNTIYAELERSVHSRLKAVALEIYRKLISRSPVYTGNFRASWNISTLEQYVDAVGGSPEAPLPPPSASFSIPRNADTAYITNGKPYAERLENGWSKQAPLGILAVTLAEYQ